MLTQSRSKNVDDKPYNIINKVIDSIFTVECTSRCKPQLLMIAWNKFADQFEKEFL